MLGFLLLKGKPATIRLLRGLAKEKKKQQPQNQRNSLHQQEHVVGHAKHNCTLLLDKRGTRRLNPAEIEKGLERVEPLTQIRINAIKLIGK